jgi:hypothetical protein
MKKITKKTILLIILMGLTLLSSCTKSEDTPTPLLNTFTLTVNGSDVLGIIDQASKTVTITVPTGTDLKALTGKATYSSGASINSDPATATDYTSPQTFIIKSTDGTASAAYVVKVTVSSIVALNNFTLVSPSISNLKTSIIVMTAGQTVTLKNAQRWIQANLAGLNVSFTLEDGATASVVGKPFKSGDLLNFSTRTATIRVTKGERITDYTLTIPAFNAETNLYGLTTVGDLSDVRNGLDGNYKLLNDITMPAMEGYDNTADPVGMKISDYSTAGWLPLGYDQNKGFLGFFDGNGHTISNLSIKRPGQGYLGFLGNTYYNKNTIIVQNLGLLNVNVNGGTITGGLAGACGSCTNCYVTGTVTGEYQVGGLIGDSTANLSNCYTKAVVNLTSGYNAGGLAGASGTGTISNCYTTGTVKGTRPESNTDANEAGLGGLIGRNFSNCINCYATGKVTGTGTKLFAGGLIGINKSLIANCYSTGNVSGNSKMGGLIGYNDNSNINNSYGVVKNSYWDTITTGQNTNSGGIGLGTVEMQAAQPYDKTWTNENWIFTGGQYPKLKGVSGQ